VHRSDERPHWSLSASGKNLGASSDIISTIDQGPG
jgi:hypothetical protein